MRRSRRTRYRTWAELLPMPRKDRQTSLALAASRETMLAGRDCLALGGARFQAALLEQPGKHGSSCLIERRSATYA